METKANYLLIGLFTLAGLLGTLAFLLWLAKVEVERQYQYFEIVFDNVSGLAEASGVRYNGLPVGQVVALRLDPEDPSKVRVRVELAANTPVKTDTQATLQAQGVTGIGFVALSGGSLEAQPLPEGGVIEATASPLQSVLEGAPVLLQRAVELLESIDEIVNDTNRAAINEVLANAASASGRLDRALADFEALSADLGTAAGDFSAFTGRLDALANTAEVTLETATETLEQGQDAIARGATALETADTTLQSASNAFARANTLMDQDIAPFLRQGTATAERLDATLETLTPSARATLDRAQATLDVATQTFAAANRVLGEDFDGMISDVRLAVSAFRETVTNASGDIDTIADEVLAASQSAAQFAATLDGVVTTNERQLSSFLRLGLPEFLRLTEEARQLVRNLDRFVDRIDRDPARYFLGTQGTEFSR
jgi:phospholipid/cholesterol/gamma-HCH transport system substrate-binding protein